MTDCPSSETKLDPHVVEIKEDTLPPSIENATVLPPLPRPVHRVTGEHPPVRATSTDDDTLTPVVTGQENTSANLQNCEPEDTLPDYLDQHR